MNRSVFFARRLLSRRHGLQFTGKSNKFHSRSGSSSRQNPSTFWVGAVATCVFFQIYDKNITTAEGKREEDDPPKEGTPWYRRYPTLNLERLRYPTVKKQEYVETPPPKTTEEKKDHQTLFYGQCLQRQLWHPPVPYPAWDYNWDGKMLDGFFTLEVLGTAHGLHQSHKTGTTRHILLVRHGQYEECHLEDRKRCLTALGRRQAQLTGQRLGALMEAIGVDKVKAIYTSDMLRAKQTAWIMAKSLPDGISLQAPDPELNEGLPAPIIPPRPDLVGLTEEVDECAPRMERAFQKYFYRADPPPSLKQALLQTKQEPPEYNISTSGTISMRGHDDDKAATANPKTPTTTFKVPPPQHEFDILVCHGNLIRYFACRALQLPPEAWLRLSVFNCSITYIMIKPNGYVACRMLGDIGHLGYKETTFSGAHGLVWS